ncbi:MAG: hypothetical protein FWD46_06350 [Cystobacterineae bacterium]|nr:hypothetical protein [Cystobacterineae bacterium]
MSMTKKHWMILGLFLLAPTAFAAEEADSNSFGILGGFSTNKNMVLQAGVGLPGLQTKFLIGILSQLDVGGILELNWADIHGGDFALRFQGAVRYAFYNSGRLGLSAGMSPGLRVEFVGNNAGTFIDVLLHMDFSAGIRITPQLTAVVAFEIPLELWTKGEFSAYIPLVAATGLEYGITSSLKLWSMVRAGHGFSTLTGSNSWAGRLAGAGGLGGGGGTQGGLFSFHVGAAFAF